MPVDNQSDKKPSNESKDNAVETETMETSDTNINTDFQTPDSQAIEQTTESNDSLKDKLKEAQAEAVKNLDIALRNQAEIENIRRRMTKEIESAHKFATEKFAKELLNIVDSIELGLKAADEEGITIESLKEGMILTKQQFFNTFEQLNIEVIDALGTKFNPELHEAMTTIDSPDSKPNTVIEVIQKGYILNDRLLRPSRVIVSKS